MKRAAFVVLVVALVAMVARDVFHVKRTPDPVVVRLRTDQMIQALEDEGWAVVTANVFSGLLDRAAGLEADTTRMGRALRVLAEEARLAGAELRAVTELSAQAESALRLSGQAHADTLMRLTREPEYANLAGLDSIVAPFDDGVFDGRVAYFPGPGEFSLLVRAEIAAALAVTEAADGRVLFSAIPADPRVRIRLDRALYQRPEPVQACSWGQRAKWALLGAAGGALVAR